MSKPKVLFLCTGNTSRSQMAEGFLRAIAPERFEAFSAGLEAGGVNPMAVEAMAECGVDISSQRSKPLSDFLGQVHFGYLVTVCDRAERGCPVFPGMGQRLHWSFPDPAAAEGSEEERLGVFREGAMPSRRASENGSASLPKHRARPASRQPKRLSKQKPHERRVREERTWKPVFDNDTPGTR